MKLNTLKRRAQQATVWRGHRMRWQQTSSHSLLGTCTKCGAVAQCLTQLQPNDIDVGGPAVAVNCTGEVKYHPAFPKGYGIRGADMGRSNVYPDELSKDTRYFLKRSDWVDGCYDIGGAYWGHGIDIYCGWNREDLRVYVRATSRRNAREQINAGIAKVCKARRS